MNIPMAARKAFSSLKTQLLLPILLVMVVIVFALTTLVSQAYTRTILEQENVKMHSAFTLTSDSIETQLQTLQTGASHLLLDSDVELYLSNRFTSDVNRVLARKATLDVLRDSMFRQPNLYGLLFFREDGTAFGSLPYRNYFFDENPVEMLDAAIIGQVLATPLKQNRWLGPVSAADLYQIKVNSAIPDQVILGVSSVHFATYGSAYAVAVVDTAILKERISLLADGRSQIYLTTGEGVELARAGGEPLSAQTWSAVDPALAQDGVSIEKDGGRVYVCYQRIESLGWYLIRELPMASYDRTVSELNLFVWKMAFVVFAAAFLVLLQWLRRLLRSFEALRSAIAQVGSGRLEARIDQPFHVAEFESIRQEFNAMNSALERMMETTRAMERTQLELELRNLQTRLSPHMIFNSITAIRWMATMLGADRVADMLMELSEMLRPVFHDWKIEWTLGEELAHLSHYAKLLDLRYGNHFSMTCEIDRALDSLRIPRFTLQPLVENACEHGSTGANALHIAIYGEFKDGRVRFTVADNGAGMTPEVLDGINRRLKSGQPGESVGLYSVYNRLRLCMGDSACLRLECPPEGGTVVTVEWLVTDESYQI